MKLERPLLLVVDQEPYMAPRHARAELPPAGALAPSLSPHTQRSMLPTRRRVHSLHASVQRAVLSPGRTDLAITTSHNSDNQPYQLKSPAFTGATSRHRRMPDSALFTLGGPLHAWTAAVGVNSIQVMKPHYRYCIKIWSNIDRCSRAARGPLQCLPETLPSPLHAGDALTRACP